MYTVSEAYKKAASLSTRNSKVYGSLRKKNGTAINFTSADIFAGSLSIDNAAVSGQELNLGTVYAAKFKFSLKTDADRYSLYDAEVNLTYSLQLQDGTWEDVPLGVFYVSEAQKSGKYVALSGYDKMLEFDKPLEIRTSGTPYELLSVVCEDCGVEMAQTQSEIDAMSPGISGGIYKYGIPTETSLSSYRALLAELAILLGGFAIIDRTGKLRICRFGTKQNLNITDRLRKSADIYDYKCGFSGLTGIVDGAYELVGTTEKTVLDIGELSLLKNGLTSIKKNTLNCIYNSIKDLEYTPCSIDYIGDPALDLGDIIQISGYNADNDAGTFTCIMSYVWKFHGTHKLAAVGENTKLAKVKKIQNNRQNSSTHSIVADAQLKTFTYINAEEVSIDSTLKSIISCALPSMNNTSITVMGQIIADIKQPGNFQIIYTIDGVVQKFSPKQTITTPGYHTFNVFYTLNKENATENTTFNVLMKTEGGTGKVEIGDCIVNLFGCGIGAVLDNTSRLTIEDEYTNIPFVTVGFNYDLTGTVEINKEVL